MREVFTILDARMAGVLATVAFLVLLSGCAGGGYKSSTVNNGDLNLTVVLPSPTNDVSYTYVLDISFGRIDQKTGAADVTPTVTATIPYDKAKELGLMAAAPGAPVALAAPAAPVAAATSAKDIKAALDKLEARFRSPAPVGVSK